MTVCAVVRMGHVSACVTVGLPLSLERNTLVLTVAVILTTATTQTKSRDSVCTCVIVRECV